MTPFTWAALGLLALDAVSRQWNRAEALPNALYLLLPYGPMLALQHLAPWEAVVLTGVLGFGAHFNFSRMVGLTGHPLFYLASLSSTLAFYAAAPLDWYGLFQALPAFGIFFIVLVGAVREDARAILQRICLAWVGLLVYGYLWGHAALLAEQPFPRFGVDGPGWLAYLVFTAKAGDTLWTLGRRLGWTRASVQMLTTAGGATAAAMALPWLGCPLNFQQAATTGVLIGAGLGLGSRAFDLVVADVTGQPAARPLKGTMLFGFSFSLALSYHWLRYLS